MTKKIAIARRIRPSVAVKLDTGEENDLELKLSFSLNALARIEERTGLQLVGNVFTLWGEIASARVLGATFWSAVVENNPEYDSDEGFEILTSYLDGENMGRAAEAIAEAYPLFLSKPQADLFRKMVAKATQGEDPPNENPTEGQPEPPSSTGESSGPSPDTISGSASAS